MRVEGGRMITSRRFFVLLWALLGAAWVQAQQSGDDERHEYLKPAVQGERDVRSLLDRKLGRAGTMANYDAVKELVKKWLEQGDVDAKDLERLKKSAKGLGVNGENLTEKERADLQRDFQGLLKDLKAKGKVTDDQLKDLKDFKDNIADRPKPPVPDPSTGSAGSQGSGLRPPPDTSSKPPSGSSGGISSSQGSGVALPPPPKVDLGKKDSEGPTKLSDRLFGKGGLLSRSSGLSKTFSKLASRTGTSTDE